MEPLLNTETPAHRFGNPAAWRAWLEINHSQAGAWLQIGKKGQPGLMTIDEAREVALCYGWIDSQRKACDASSFLQKYGPRTARSPWSLKNRTLAEQLMAEGRMTAVGLAEIARARRDGRWDIAYVPQGEFSIPRDFRELDGVDESLLNRLAQLPKSELYLLFLPALKVVSRVRRERRYREILARLE